MVNTWRIVVGRRLEVPRRFRPQFRGSRPAATGLEDLLLRLLPWPSAHGRTRSTLDRSARSALPGRPASSRVFCRSPSQKAYGKSSASHQCDVSCRNHVCRGRLARHHRQDRDDRCPWSTLRALNIPVGHQGKYVFAYLEPVMPPESIHTRAYIGHARDVAGDAEVTSTAEKSDWQGPAGTSSQFERARADALRQPHQMPLQ
jgi:hypothetical protein